jgi:hypothetical protein
MPAGGIMKRFLLICLVFGFISGIAFAAEPELSGVADTTINYTAGTGDAPESSLGIEEYANLRLRFRVGEKAIFYAAFNLTALAGNYLENAALSGSLYQNPYFASTPFIYGQNYAAGMELERLYLRINGDYIDAEAGLLRINFGYGQVWGSSDFLNPRNPLFPNARPRGVLGVNASFYPLDSLKLMGFVVAPKNPLEVKGDGEIHGLSMDQHWDRASLQALYAFQNPDSAFGQGIHRFGLSVKADLELGFVVDGLYNLNPEKAEGIDGLSLGAGFDYSFLGGDLYVLAEYLFNGSSSVTALGFGGNWSNNHYLYGTALYRFNDHCNLGLSTVFCFDDLSFSPFATLNYELFQGFSLNLTARLPLDQKTLNGGKAGELGPVPPRPDGSEGTAGARFIVNAGARLRF